MKGFDTQQVLDLIRQKRTDLELGQSDLARKLGISTSNYRKIESGQVRLCMDRYLEICAVMEIPADLIFGQLENGVELDQMRAQLKRLEIAMREYREEIEYLRSQNLYLSSLLVQRDKNLRSA